MQHRRYLPLPSPHPDHSEKPQKNNQARLKNIYEAQFVFKDKAPSFKKSNRVHKK